MSLFFADNFFDMADKHSYSGREATKMWRVSLTITKVPFRPLTMLRNGPSLPKWLQRMVKAKNKKTDAGYRKEMERMKFHIRSKPTRRKKDFESYALKVTKKLVFPRCFFFSSPYLLQVMAVLDEYSRIPHISRGFPVDSTNNIGESSNNTVKQELGYKLSTIDEIIGATIRIMERQRNNVHE